jgi:hypothetical protein
MQFMQSTTMVQRFLQGFTLEDSRSITRWPCPDHRTIELVIRPHFGNTSATVRDISKFGIGLSCLKPLKPGTRLLFRVEPERRFVQAKVVHATPDLDGWHVGCLFAEPLTDDEVSAYVAPEF